MLKQESDLQMEILSSNNSFNKEYSSNHGYLKERTIYENVEELWNVQESSGKSTCPI